MEGHHPLSNWPPQGHDNTSHLGSFGGYFRAILQHVGPGRIPVAGGSLLNFTSRGGALWARFPPGAGPIGTPIQAATPITGEVAIATTGLAEILAIAMGWMFHLIASCAGGDRCASGCPIQDTVLRALRFSKAPSHELYGLFYHPVCPVTLSTRLITFFLQPFQLTHFLHWQLPLPPCVNVTPWSFSSYFSFLPTPRDHLVFQQVVFNQPLR